MLREAEGLRDELADVARPSSDAPTTCRARRAGRRATPRWPAGRRRRVRPPSTADYERCARRSSSRGHYDERDAILTHQRRRGRHRGDRLGRDAAAHVPALGRAAPLRDRDPRPARRGGGRPQERHRRHRRPPRLRLPARRARRPPPGSHQPVRLAEAAPHDVRAGRGAARGRGRRRGRRDPRRRAQDRDVPLAGRRRPARQQDRLGGAPDAPARPASSPRARTSGRSTRTASWR